METVHAVLRCRMCKEVHTLEVDKQKYEIYKEGVELIQDIFPDMSSTDREKLISGTCDKCQLILFEEE